MGNYDNFSLFKITFKWENISRLSNQFVRFWDVKALWECALFSKGIMYFDGFLRVIIWGLKGKYLAYHRSHSDIRWKKKKKITLSTWERWMILFHQINCQLTILFSVERHRTKESDFVDRKNIYKYQIIWVTEKCHKRVNCYFLSLPLF